MEFSSCLVSVMLSPFIVMFLSVVLSAHHAEGVDDTDYFAAVVGYYEGVDY